jgi:hypothetical protein
MTNVHIIKTAFNRWWLVLMYVSVIISLAVVLGWR